MHKDTRYPRFCNPTQPFYLFIFFALGLMARQDYVTHFESSQLIGGAKTDPPKK